MPIQEGPDFLKRVRSQSGQLLMWNAFEVYLARSDSSITSTHTVASHCRKNTKVKHDLLT